MSDDTYTLLPEDVIHVDGTHKGIRGEHNARQLADRLAERHGRDYLVMRERGWVEVHHARKPERPPEPGAVR